MIFLGTAGSVPTPRRSLPALAIHRKNELLVFDCGEGIQRQMMRAKMSLHKATKIFISHLHGDHILGLPGLLQTMALMDRRRPLEIYGPKGLRRFLEVYQETVSFIPTFSTEINEILKEGIVVQEKEYVIKATWSNHVVTGLAYAFVEKSRPGKFYPEKASEKKVPEGYLWSKLQEGSEVRLSKGVVVKAEEVLGHPRPGRKIVYTGDTRPFSTLAEFASGADLLIHDSTFADVLAEKAEEDGHSTSRQAAEDAKKAMVKKLLLTHISARYPETGSLLEQAQEIFKNTQVAEDFLALELPLLDS